MVRVQPSHVGQFAAPSAQRTSLPFVETPSWMAGAGVFLLYLVASQYVILLNNPVALGASFWPAAGISLAAFLLLPVRQWPWVLVGIAAAEGFGNLLHGYPLSSSLIWVAANTLEPLLSASLLRWLGWSRRLSPVRPLALFLLCGVLLGPLVGALLGSAGTVSFLAPEYPAVVLKWLAGDALGVLVMTTLLLSVRKWHFSPARWLEVSMLSAFVLFGTVAAFFPVWEQGTSDLPYLVTPLLIWAGFRFGILGASITGFVIVQGANLAAALGTGPSGVSDHPDTYSITLHQVFVGCSLATGLMVAALKADLAERVELEKVLKRTVEELRQSEARLRDYAKVASDWFWEMDERFRFTRFEGSKEDPRRHFRDGMLGKPRWEVSGASPQDDHWQEHIRCHEQHQPYRDFRFSVQDPDGKVILLSSSGRPVFRDDGTFAGYRGASTDITRQTRLEEQLRQAQKMEAVGQLTGGIAHDFNNLLTVVVGNAETLYEEDCAPQVVKELSGMILHAAERGAELTQSLLAFSRQQPLNPVQLPIRNVVQGMAPMIRRALGERIEVRIDGSSSEPLALVDRSLLESAILNLVVNARDAMPEGGVLTLTTGSFASLEGSPPMEDLVHLTVSDTGTGMPQHVIEQVFEPFFTTKDVGKGSGLGLSMVYGFAMQSGGHVNIESRVGEGTSVAIVLPSAGNSASNTMNDQGAPQHPQADRVPPQLPDREKGILVVEDE